MKDLVKKIFSNTLEFPKYMQLKSKLTQFSILLFTYALFSTFLLFDIEGGINLQQNEIFFNALVNLVILNLLSLIYFIIKKSLDDKFIVPQNLIISTNIIFLVIHPTSSFIDVAIIFAAILIINGFIRYKGFPVFNPAAIAIFCVFIISSILFNLGLVKGTIFVSWWGANLVKGIDPTSLFTSILGLILTFFFVYYAYAFRKWAYGVIFIISYIVLRFVFILFYANNIDVGLLSISNSLYALLIFFAFVMLSEPKTTPLRNVAQLFYGFIAAFIYFLLFTARNLDLLTVLDINFEEMVEVITILIMNLIFLIQKFFKK